MFVQRLIMSAILSCEALTYDICSRGITQFYLLPTRLWNESSCLYSPAA